MTKKTNQDIETEDNQAEDIEKETNEEEEKEVILTKPDWKNYINPPFGIVNNTAWEAYLEFLRTNDFED